MSRIAPPTVARWMLVHLMPGESNDALAGDLHEEFCAGRSSGWYWRQVLSAITIRCVRELQLHRSALLFAVLWSMLAPAWMLVFAKLEKYADLRARLAQMVWPWSIVCDLSLTLAAGVLFLWIGILLYLFPDLWLAGQLRMRPLLRGITSSLPALLVLWLALIVFPRHFVALHDPMQVSASRAPTPLEAYRIELRRRAAAYTRHPLEQLNKAEDRDSTPSNFSSRDAIADLRTAAMLARLPFFLVVLLTLWPRTTRTQRYAR